MLALVCSFPVAMKRREMLAHHIPIYVLLLPPILALFMMSPTQTAGHKMAALMLMFPQLLIFEWKTAVCLFFFFFLYSTPINMPTPICGPTEQQPQKTNKQKTICQNSPAAHMPDPTHLITSVSVSPKSCPYHWKRRDKEISLFCVFIFTSDWQKLRVAVSRAFSRFSSVYTLIAGQLCKKKKLHRQATILLLLLSCDHHCLIFGGLLLHTTIKKTGRWREKNVCVCVCVGGRRYNRRKGKLGRWQKEKQWGGGWGGWGGGEELMTATVAPILGWNF